MKVMVFNIPTGHYFDIDPLKLSQEWVKKKMLRREPPESWIW